MSKIDEYMTIILTSDMSDEEKISYLKVLDLVRRYSEEQLAEIENKIYTLDEKPIPDKDRMLYEINHLYDYFKNRNMDLTRVRKLYYNLRNVDKNDKEVRKVKSSITKLQLENNMNVRFYNSYFDLLDEIKKQNRRKNEGTFHK